MLNACRLPAIIVAVAALVLLVGAVPLSATEEYARDTGKGCIFCHQESTGGQLKTVGFAYIRNGYQYPIPPRILEKAEDLQGPAHTDWQIERDKMQTVCRQCHSSTWTEDHFRNLDAVVAH